MSRWADTNKGMKLSENHLQSRSFSLLGDAQEWVESNIDSKISVERFKRRLDSLRAWSETQSRGRANWNVRVYFGSQGLPTEVAFADRRTGEVVYRERV